MLLAQGSGGPKRKKSQQFKKPAIIEIEDRFYLVASDIFLLGPAVVKLSHEEVLELPVTICYSGPVKNFEADLRSCYSLLSEIFTMYNSLQNPRFVSFPIGRFSVNYDTINYISLFLAAFTYYLVGQFYPFIIKRHGTCSMQMSISGSSTSTGKSLMQTCGMLMFFGEEQPTMSSISETTTHEMLSDGCMFGK